MTQSTQTVPIQKFDKTARAVTQDALAVEEPLEIRIVVKQQRHNLSITMRTPGQDFDLALGFLFTENIIQSITQIAEIRHCGTQNNEVEITLAPDCQLDFARLQRHFYTSSSCGVCGKTSIDALHTLTGISLATHPFSLQGALIHALPQQLRVAQSVFNATGGLHAAALFDAAGNLQLLREDVGRHNAVDKLIGAQLQAGQIPLTENLLLVSGRASFELVQKALMAKIPILAAVGAPSSLAVELAQTNGMTLLGFVRDERFNIYCGAERII